MSHLKSISIVLIIAMGITQLLIHSKNQHSKESANIHKAVAYENGSKNMSNKNTKININQKLKIK